jgi:hypothetical protein
MRPLGGTPDLSDRSDLSDESEQSDESDESNESDESDRSDGGHANASLPDPKDLPSALLCRKLHLGMHLGWPAGLSGRRPGPRGHAMEGISSCNSPRSVRQSPSAPPEVRPSQSKSPGALQDLCTVSPLFTKDEKKYPEPFLPQSRVFYRAPQRPFRARATPAAGAGL